MPVTFGEEIAGRGWRTGAVIPQDVLNELGPHLMRPGGASANVQPDHWLVVVSQTCDVVARKLDAEPFVEVLHCSPIEKPRRQYRDLRSTRVLDFRPNRDTHPNLALSARAVADRYLLPRQLLKETIPDATRRLSRDAAQRVLVWYALRYGRPSWPDALVKRIDKETEEALEHALQPLKEDIAEVRVAIAEKDEELADGAPYHLVVYFIVDEAVWNGDPAGRESVQKAFADFVASLNACHGLEVDQDLSGVVSGAEFTWQDTRATDEWNFANLSHSE